jgi:hypothetical protein
LGNPRLDTRNFLEETEDFLKDWGGLNKVSYIGSSNGKFQCTVKEFRVMADQQYDSGYGGQMVAEDLVIVINDVCLFRKEYDGSERWDFVYMPIFLCNKPKKFKRVICDPKEYDACWSTIENLNKK